MNKWQHYALFFSAGLIFSAVILLVASPPDQKPILLLPTLPPDNIFIHVAGEVKNQGVITLEFESRVIDAVEAAGGFTPNASTEGLNLARTLVDGEYLFIPSKEQVSTDPSNLKPSSSNLQNSTLININAASLAVLDQLPGIGTTKAQDIIEYRLSHGPFQSLEEVMNVPGIGEEIFDEIRELITIK